MTDVIVIGGGLNGLIAAMWLARRQYSVLVVERQAQVGGAAVTEVTPKGFHRPTLSHAIGPLSQDVIRSLRLDRLPIEFLRPEPALTVLGHEQTAISFHRDHVLTAASIARVSEADAGQWQPFVDTMLRLSNVLVALNQRPAPSVDDPATADLWHLLKVGRRVRGLGRRDLARLSRYLPIAVADLVAEWFEHDLTQTAVAARGVFGHPVGPWSAGTGALLLQRVAEDPMPVGGGVTVKGGPGALTAALLAAATDLGVQVRTGSEVTSVMTRGGSAVGVVLASGEELPAHAVVSAIPPKTLLTQLVDPGDLPPVFRQRIGQVRSRGVTAKVNLSLDGLPEFPALNGDAVPLSGRLLLAGSIDELERAHDAAKYGEVPGRPWIELSLPSVIDTALAPEGRHVLSAYVHNVPASADIDRDRVYAATMAVLGEHAPDIDGLVLEHDVLTPADLESRWGLSGGHIFHGEGALDQWYAGRPLLGWAHHHATPVDGLFLASAGSHPGGGLTGQAGLNAARVIATRLDKRRPW